MFDGAVVWLGNEDAILFQKQQSVVCFCLARGYQISGLNMSLNLTMHLYKIGIWR